MGPMKGGENSLRSEGMGFKEQPLGESPEAASLGDRGSLSSWLALSIGNSRLHWAWFRGKALQETQETPHLPSPDPEFGLAAAHWPWSALVQGITHNFEIPDPLPELWVVSVVPAQTAFWASYPGVQILALNQIPLAELYPTLGIDRALALWGAGSLYGWPVLVIDAGTALTFSAANSKQQLVGGAILPGLGLQLRSLAQSTAALPTVALPETLPHRWARNTPAAIQSGTIYTLVAGMVDFVSAWCQEFPQSQVVLTGGDRLPLANYLAARFQQISPPPTWFSRLIHDPHLILRSLQVLREANPAPGA